MTERSPEHERARHVATRIVRRLRERGHVAYFAGGCVRDELLGLAPEDYDVATDATPEQLHAHFRRVNEVGAAFGVALVHEDGVTVEIATFREEGEYTDKRRPDKVRFSTSDRDARRRDFTINALFLDPLEEPSNDRYESGAVVAPGPGGGRVVDYVGGLADLSARVIRAVGDPDARLAEDHLRALRAVRFTARLGERGFRLDEATGEAVRRHAAELAGVSRERIGDELRRMLLAPSAVRAAEWMERLCLAPPVLDEPAGTARAGAGSPPTLAALRGLEGVTPDRLFTARLGAWLLDRWPGGRPGAEAIERGAPEVVRRVRAALCLTNSQREGLRSALAGVARLERGWDIEGVASQKRASVAGWFAPALAIVRARDEQEAEKVEARVAALAATTGGLSPAPLLTGDDIVALGASPGPRIGSWLTRIYDEQLEGRVRTRTEAVARVAAWMASESGAERPD